MLPNNLVIMLNSKLSDTKLINYYDPQKELSVPVDVGVHSDSDLEHVERVTLEVARETLKNHEWGVSDYGTSWCFTPSTHPASTSPSCCAPRNISTGSG